jgi:hypothetical protein
MGKIYVGQSALTFKLDTEIDLSSASDTRIYYKKPSGSTGYWDATTTETTKLKYEVEDTSKLDEAGVWAFWGYAEIAGKIIYGEPKEKYVFSPGQ